MSIDPLTVIKGWLLIRPIRWIKEARQAKREARRKAAEAAGGEFIYEDDNMKLFEKLAELRTSTKSGAAGLVTLGVMSLPIAEPVSAYLKQACANPDGPLPFIIAGGVTWLVMFVSARLSKTPAVPGKL